MFRILRTGLFILSLIAICAYLLPVIRGFISAFETSINTQWSSDAPSAFKDLVDNRRLLDSVLRSAHTACATAAAAVIVAFLAVIAWLNAGPAFKRLLLACFLLPLFVPETTHALAISGFLVRLNLDKGTIMSTIALAPACLPFAAVVLLLAALAIHSSVWKASYDLGMNKRRIFRAIIWPLMWPGFTTAFTFSAIAAFNEVSRTKYCSAREAYSGYLSGVFASGGSPGVYAVASLMFALGIASLIILFVRMANAKKAGASS